MNVISKVPFLSLSENILQQAFICSITYKHQTQVCKKVKPADWGPQNIPNIR